MTKPFKFSRNRMVFLCSALLLLVPCEAVAQVIGVTSDTATPIPGAGHDYIKMLSETVNPADGSVSVRIQVPVPKGRGLTVPFSFAYDSNGTHYPISVTGGAAWMTSAGFLSSGGWTYAVPMVSWLPTSTSWTETYPPYQTLYCNFTTDYVFQDAQGGRHSLNLAIVPNPTSTACQETGVTGSFNSGGDPLVIANDSGATGGWGSGPGGGRRWHGVQFCRSHHP